MANKHKLIQRERQQQPPQEVAMMRTTYGRTTAEHLAEFIRSGERLTAAGAMDLNRELRTTSITRLLNSSHLVVSPEDNNHIMGFAGVVMGYFSHRVPKLKIVEKLVRNGKRPRWTKDVRVYVYEASIHPRYIGQRPDLVVKISNAKMPDVPFVPPYPGSLINEFGRRLDEMSGNDRRIAKQYIIMGWMLFNQWIKGKGSAYHAMYYLRKKGQ